MLSSCSPGGGPCASASRPDAAANQPDEWAGLTDPDRGAADVGNLGLERLELGVDSLHPIRLVNSQPRKLSHQMGRAVLTSKPAFAPRTSPLYARSAAATLRSNSAVLAAFALRSGSSWASADSSVLIWGEGSNAVRRSGLS